MPCLEVSEVIGYIHGDGKAAAVASGRTKAKIEVAAGEITKLCVRMYQAYLVAIAPEA